MEVLTKKNLSIRIGRYEKHHFEGYMGPILIFKDNFENTGIKIYQFPTQEVENIITDKKPNSTCC